MSNENFSVFKTMRDPVVLTRDDTITDLNAAAARFGWYIGRTRPSALPVLSDGAAELFAEAEIGGAEYTVAAFPYAGGVLYTLTPCDESGNSGDFRMAESIAAEMRDPVAVMCLAAQYLLPIAENLGEQRAYECATALNRALYRLRRLTGHLDAFAASESVAGKMNFAIFDLAETCAETVETANDLIGGGHAITFETRERAALINGDRRMIKKVLLTLIGNAVKYAGDGANIHISLRSQGGRVLLTVADNGAGIPLSERDNARARYRAPRAPGDIHGAGFSLSIVSAAAKRHGGSFWLESEPGKRTVAAISLPAAPRGSAELRTPSAEYNDGSGALIELSDVLPPERYSQRFMD